MTIEGANLVNQLAQRLSITDVDGHTTFKVKGEIKKDGKVFNSVKVHLHTEVLESIIEENIADSTKIEKIIDTLDIVE